MSEFFYKEKLGPVFSPVIKVKRENMPPAVISAIDNLLSPSGNMFTRAETVKNLMSIERFNLDQTAKALSLKRTDIANKLRLLEFSEKERDAILDYGFSETATLQFLSLDKMSRLYAMEYCRKNGFTTEQIEGYVEGIVNSKTAKKQEVRQKIENVTKIAVNDVGFFLNSIENALRIAKNAGFDVENEKKEKEDSLDIHIKVKKKKRE